MRQLGHCALQAVYPEGRRTKLGSTNFEPLQIITFFIIVGVVTGLFIGSSR
jgi:hypothetical protein